MQLLFETTGAIAAVGGYTESQLSIGITDLHCNGSEASILNCSHNNLEEYNCASRDDAGVICQGQYLLSAVIAKHTLGELAEQGNVNGSRVGTKPGLWTGPWTGLWTGSWTRFWTL